MLFWTDDVSVIRVSRCGITRVTLSGKHVLTLIWMIMTGGSFKIVSNWAVLTISTLLGAILSWGILWPLISKRKGDWYPADVPESSMSSLYGYKVC